MSEMANGLSSEMLVMIGTAAMATVGFIEVLKNFVKTKSSKVWTLVMIPLSVLNCVIYIYLPVWVMAGILTVSACQIGYDYILHTFTKIVGRIGEK